VENWIDKIEFTFKKSNDLVLFSGINHSGKTKAIRCFLFKPSGVGYNRCRKINPKNSVFFPLHPGLDV